MPLWQRFFLIISIERHTEFIIPISDPHDEGDMNRNRTSQIFDVIFKPRQRSAAFLLVTFNPPQPH
jgi:hypothetical protein